MFTLAVCFTFWICFQVLLVTAAFPSSVTRQIHQLPHTSTLTNPWPSYIPRSFTKRTRPFPTCFHEATDPKYASCTLWFIATYPTKDDPNPLDIAIHAPKCGSLLLYKPYLPLDKNITINTASTQLDGDLAIQVANGSWYQDIWYDNRMVDFQLPVDKTGTPYYPPDFLGKVVRWTAFECKVRSCAAGGTCDAMAGVAKVDGVVVS